MSSISNYQIRAALLPTEKILPLLVASSEELFSDKGISVELEVIRGASLRDEAAGQEKYDCYMMNLVSVVLAYLDGSDLKATRVLLRSSQDHTLFRLLARPGLLIHPRRNSEPFRLGISRHTVVEYVTFHFMNVLGLTMGDLTIVDIPDIEARLNLLLKGELDYATLPEPMASSAVDAGAFNIIDDTRIVVPPPVLAFHASVLNSKAEAVRDFLAAIDSAALLINSEPNRFRHLLTDYHLLPGDHTASYVVPRFPVGDVPNLDDIECIFSWLQASHREATALPSSSKAIETILFSVDS